MSSTKTESAPGDATAVAAKALTKTFKVGFLMNREVAALRGLDFTIGGGEVFGLVGPNGAGKSTTIKILMNLVRASSGEASIFGKSPEDPEVRRLIGFVPENPAPYEYLTGGEFITLAGRLVGLSGKELDARVTEVLRTVEMERASKMQIRRYSKGMVQRIALAQALVGRPRLLILDEPTSGLDPLGRRQIRELILAERKKGTTVLFCSHVIPDVEALCDRIVIIVGGRRVREGRVSELLTTTGERFELVVEGLPADKRASFPEAESLEDGRVKLELPGDRTQAALSELLAAGGRVTRVQPVRATLEQIFMTAMEEAGPGGTVGGDIH